VGDGLSSREVLSGNEGHKAHHGNAAIDQLTPRGEDEVALPGCAFQDWHQGGNNPEQESGSNRSRVCFDLLKHVLVGGDLCCQCCNNTKHGQPAGIHVTEVPCNVQAKFKALVKVQLNLSELNN